jgi:pyruvate formate lyase activating enzyme
MGLCGVRRNEGGRLYLPWFGATSSIAVDPIEKKPLYHFRPGSQILSVGFVGCNLRCPFCQNWEISQGTRAATEHLEPSALVALALQAGTGALAYTYSEPLVHAEYLIEAMSAARGSGLANVLVTNGCILRPASAEVLAACDAANIDLKAWNPDFYRAELGGDRDAVLRFIEEALGAKVHVEVSTLVIPGKNDGEDEIDSIARFLAGLSPDLVLHLSAYRPMYKYTEAPTRSESLERLAKVARASLPYVYIGNVQGEENNDLCTSCGATLVRRRDYKVDASGLARGPGTGARCAACNATVPFRL